MIGQRIGGYVLEEELGRGGMGAVYRARGTDLDREVALKLLVETDPVTVVRFQREAQAAAKVRHPNLTTVHDSGVADGHAYLVMDLIRGVPLSDRLAPDLPTPEEAAAWIAAIARGVAALHDAGLLHRDLKPSNMLLAEDGRVFLTDFGVALDLSLEQRLSLTGDLLGTPCYMAPEQAEARRDVDERSDVYGLGASLYHLLTGQPPFKGSTIRVLTQVAEVDPVDPTLLRAGLDPDLAAICLRALAKAPSARPASAREVAEALEGWLAGERRSSPGRAPLVAASLALVAALTGLGWTFASDEGAVPGPVSPRAAPSTSPPATLSLERVLALPRQERARAAGRMSSADWARLADRLSSRGTTMNGSRFEELLELLGQAPELEEVQRLKREYLERDAVAWGEALSTSPDDQRLARLCAFVRQTPRVWAGPKLSQALTRALQVHLKISDTNGSAQFLRRIAWFEDRLFYELDPRPRWSLRLVACLSKLAVDPKLEPRLALSQVRYWTRNRPLEPLPNDWLERALSERPRSAIRGVLAFCAEHPTSRRRGDLAQVEGAVALAKQTDRLPDLNPRHLVHLIRAFVSRTTRGSSPAEAARIGQLKIDAGLTIAKALAENPCLALGSEFIAMLEMAADGKRLAGEGEAGLIEVYRAGFALTDARAAIKFLDLKERMRYATRIEKGVRVARARLHRKISASLWRQKKPEAALREIRIVFQDQRRLPGHERGECRGLEAQLLLELGRSKEAAVSVKHVIVGMLRSQRFAEAAIRVALEQGDTERIDYLTRRARQELRPHELRAFERLLPASD